MLAVGILFLAQASSPRAQATGYTYRLIFGPGGGGPAAGIPYDPPAINDDGLVVGRPDCHILVFGNGSVSSAAGAPLGCRGGGAIALNNDGVVAFDNAYSVPPQSFDRILTTTGNNQFTTLADEAVIGRGRFDSYSINNSNSVAFGEGSLLAQGLGGFILARPNGDPLAPLVTVSNPTVPGAFGLLDAAGPSINENGAIAFNARNVPGIFLADGGPLVRLAIDGAVRPVSLNNMNQVAFSDGTRVLVVDGGPVPQAPARIVASATSAGGAYSLLLESSLNDNGTVAFVGQVGGVTGIFTGPDPIAHSIVKVGTTINVVSTEGVPIPVQIQALRFQRDGLNNRGQIAFSALTNLGQFVIRADPPGLEPLPPGSTPGTPLPPINASPPWEIPIRWPRTVCELTNCVRAPLRGGGGRGWLDPAVAVGYTYTASNSPNFAQVLIPAALPGGDDSFTVEFAGVVHPLTAGIPFLFTDHVAGGVSTFTIRGIDVDENLDPNNPFAFVTGLMWVDGFDGSIIMTPLTSVSDGTAPVLTVPGTITRAAQSAAGAVVTFAVSAVDESDPNPSVTCEPASGSLFPIGSTQVTCTARDASGNSASASFSIIVVEQRRLSGSGFHFPETPTYRATFAVDGTGPLTPSGQIQYYYARTRMNFVSSGITSAVFTGSTLTLTGAGTVNGVSGFAFTATATDGSPDRFGIVIRRADGSILFNAGAQPLGGGSLTLSAR
jgi:hypothetical protein